MYLPRNKRAKLKHKWMGQSKITECRHLVYQVEINIDKMIKNVWLVRSYIKQAPQNVGIVEFDLYDGNTNELIKQAKRR